MMTNEDYGVALEELKVLENFFEAVGQAFSSMLLAFWDADSSCRIHAFVQAEVSCFGKDRTERHLHQLVRSIREFLVVCLLLFV